MPKYEVDIPHSLTPAEAKQRIELVGGEHVRNRVRIADDVDSGSDAGYRDGAIQQRQRSPQVMIGGAGGHCENHRERRHNFRQPAHHERILSAQ